MKRRRKRSTRRTTLKAAPILWLAFIANTCLGFMFSPVTAARRVRIEGAHPNDQARLAAIAETLKGTPCLRVNPRDVESQAVSDVAIRSAELTRSIFGTDRLRVAYRKAVARYFTDPNIGVSLDGTIFRAPVLSGDLPVLKLPAGEVQVALGLVATWDASRLAGLCADAATLWPNKDLMVELTEDRGVCLNIAAGRVVLGQCDRLDFKLDVLKKRLERNPTELDQIEELVLTEPNFPRIKRKKGDHRL